MFINFVYYMFYIGFYTYKYKYEIKFSRDLILRIFNNPRITHELRRTIYNGINIINNFIK